MNPKVPRVLLLCEGAASTIEMLAIATRLSNHPSYTPMLVVADREARSLISGIPDGIEVVPFGEQSTSRSEPNPREAHAKAPPRRRLTRIGVIAFIATLRSLLSLRRSAERLIATIDPVSLLLGSDRGSGTQMAFVAASRRLRKPTILIPYAESDPDIAAYLRRGNKILLLGASPHSLLKAAVSKLWRNQVRTTPYGRMLFANAPTTIALFLAGLLPPRPWLMGGGRSDIVAVSGERDRQRLLAEGLTAERVVVTGQATLDELYRAAQRRELERKRLASSYHFDPKGKVICCAVPHLFEHRILTESEHLRETEWLFDLLASLPATVLLSLHPKSDRNTYADMAARHGLSILDEPLRNILPIADLFVASLSSTLRWAVALGIPTVVMDHYGLTYPDYSDLPGVVIVEERRQVREHISRGLEMDPFSTDAKDYEEEGGAIRFDGEAVNRIIRLIEQSDKSSRRHIASES